MQGVGSKIFLILLMWPMFLIGQQKDFAFTQLYTKDGLSNSRATCLLQDHHGFIWIGTENGLNRYDGYDVETFVHQPNDPGSLPSNGIHALFLDKENRLWVGTSSGLARYDEYSKSFRVYTMESDKLGAISNNLVNTIVGDKFGNVWIGTSVGLNLYEKVYDGFACYSEDPKLQINGTVLDSLSRLQEVAPYLPYLEKLLYKKFEDEESLFIALKLAFSNKPNEKLLDRIGQVVRENQTRRRLPVNSQRIMATDQQGNIWIAPNFGGLIKYHLNSGRSQIIKPGTHSFFSSQIFSLCVTGSRILAGGNQGDIALIDENMEYEFVDIPLQGQQIIMKIKKASGGGFWICTSGGLFLLNEHYKFVRSFTREDFGIENVKTSSVRDILYDHQGNLWIGHMIGGVSRSTVIEPFDRFEVNNRSFRDDLISAFIKDNQDRIWIGYFAGGIDIVDRDGKILKEFLSSWSGQSFMGSVLCLFQDSRSTVWVGTYNAGLLRYDSKTDSLLPVLNEGKVIRDVRSIAEDPQGNLWIGSHGDGLYKYHPDGKIVSVKYPEEFLAENLIVNYTNTLKFDHDQRLWIGTAGGMIKYSQTGGFKLYQSEGAFASGLSNTVVFDICQTDDGNLWVGTKGGLFRYSEDSDDFEKLQIELSNNIVFSIVEDLDHNLWLSSAHGITLVHRNTLEWNTVIYTIKDGLPSNEFFAGSALKIDGEIFLGSQDGIIRFDPRKFKKAAASPNVVCTDVRLYNQSYSEKGLNLSENEDGIQTLSLDHDQRYITFKYTAIDFTHPERITYAYRLNGFDDNQTKWAYVGKKREATYTNLEPGSYQFVVTTRNADGKWNDNFAQINIIINPPFWKTIWAYLIYLMFILAVLIVARNIILGRERYKNQIKLSKLEIEKNKEIEDLKLRFFTNISHEIRTPLTLILGPLQKLLSHEAPLHEDQVRRELKVVENNSKRLLHLINQILDFRKIDNDGYQLRVEKLDLISFCSEIIHAFSGQALHKSIELEMIHEVKELHGYFDTDIMQKVLFNLLSNALKFTPPEGKIFLRISQHQEEETSIDHPAVMIEVKDTGPGIPKNRIASIFERFYQVDNQMLGTGIGLSLTRDLIRLHKGEIGVESDPALGTVFRVVFPVGDYSYSSDEKKSTKESYKIEDSIAHLYSEDQVLTRDPESYSESRSFILVIDDNEDIRAFIANSLIEGFEVIQAGDGEIGLEKAMTYVPDLIICDVMMPKVDGLEFCDRVRKDQKTSHIPVLLLTAKTGVSNEIRGLSVGADDYITKPFDIGVLKEKIKNLLQRRDSLREYYKSQWISEPHVEQELTMDEIFIRDLVHYIEENAWDEEFSVEQLAEKLSIHRAQLYRKVDALLGTSVYKFMKTTRLKLAAKYIEQDSGLTITEIAHKTGFKTQPFFTKAFKEHFGVSPSQYSAKVHSD